MNWIQTNYFKNNLGLRLFPLIGLIFMLNNSFGQCYTQESQALTFHASEQNSDSTYSTIYVLADYQGNILSTSSDTSFGLQAKGLYKIYGVNYATQFGIDGLFLGSSIDSLDGVCIDISEPFEVLVCLDPVAGCHTYDGTYSFQSVGGNSDLTTVYVLTALDQTIIQISDTTSFSGIDPGEYLVFPINYSDIINLVIGGDMINLSGLCYHIGSPILIKSCSNCFVNAGSDIELCTSQSLIIAAMGSSDGEYIWSNGLSGSAVQITPTSSLNYSVTFTDSFGCIASDDIFISILGNIVADAGEDQFITCGSQAIITAAYVENATYRWSGGQMSQSILVSPTQTTTYNVTVTVGDCYTVDHVTIFINPINEPISGDTLICNGQSTTLYACDGTSYAWSTGDTTSFINVNPTSTQTYSVTVTKSSGCQSVASITVYVRICGKIGDSVWEDLNGNGRKDLEEPGIGNVEIVLFRNGVQYETTFSDPEGMYFFTYLEPANYVVRFKTPEGFVPSAQDIGGNDAVDSDFNVVTGFTPTYAVIENYTNYTIDAGFYRKAEIGDLVWEDRNKNGLKDATELGIEGIEVRIVGNDGLGNVVNLTTFTNNAGNYLFSDLSPGQYAVTFVKPDDYTFSPQNVGTDETKDSDADIVTGSSEFVSLNSGIRYLWLDAGMYKCGQIGDYVWLDTGSEENVQDAGDIGINGIIVQLFKTSEPTNILQTVASYSNEFTGLQGYYNFDVCDEGTYFIKVIVGNDYNFVLANQGVSDEIDSDIIDVITGTSTPFVLGYAEIKNDLDIGFRFKPLPIELLRFNGKRNTMFNVNELWWSTIIEVNNDHFLIKRSLNGSDYEDLTKVKGNGTSTNKQDYSYVDDRSDRIGDYYYKLVQVDYDGREQTYGPIIISVEHVGNSSISLFPNPTGNFSTLLIDTPIGSLVSGSLLDVSGKLIKEIMVNEITSSEMIEIILNSEGLNKGVYTVRLVINGNVQTLRWMVLE
ncbi:MAG TPA: SdrD B-like domain-containing protein [Saprospiraceae bacterium]|nr:SdrD B-like domain-containing protein [Saprospiraceae bacterium]